MPTFTGDRILERGYNEEPDAIFNSKLDDEAIIIAALEKIFK